MMNTPSGSVPSRSSGAHPLFADTLRLGALVAAGLLATTATGQALGEGSGSNAGAAGLPSCVKWVQTSDPELWMPDSIALADFGASVITARSLTGGHVSVHASGSPESAFAIPSNPNDSTAVAGAAFAPVGARCFDQLDPVSQVLHPHVEVFDTYGDGTPSWTRALTQPSPPAAAPTAPASAESIVALRTFVALSRDGSRVVAGGEDRTTGSTVLRAYDAAGTLLAAQDFPHAQFSWGFDATADASRVVLDVGAWLYVYNTETATVELEYKESPGGAVAISQDGSRVAMGGRVFLPNNQGSTDPYGRVVIFERDDAGVWRELRRLQFAIETRVQEIDLDADGDRAAFAFRFEVATKTEVHLYDVDEDETVFVHTAENPSSFFPIVPTAVKMDDAGRKIAVTTWGDSAQVTPEVMLLDETGTRICAFNSRGSALAVDLTPSGDRFAAAATSRHVSSFTNRGDVYYGVTPPARIDYSGLPRAGRQLQFQVAGGLESWTVMMSGARLPRATAQGLAIDPEQIVRTWDSATSLASAPLTVPPGREGTELHFQAMSVGGSSVEFSNVVSLRVVE